MLYHGTIDLYITYTITNFEYRFINMLLPSVDRSSHVRVSLERKRREIQGLRIQCPRILLRRGTFFLQLCMLMGLVSFKENINYNFHYLTLFTISFESCDKKYIFLNKKYLRYLLDRSRFHPQLVQHTALHQ